MITKISIKNIQSHKNSTLELSPGINAIVGSSNNGKSAILRAFYWARYNRPLGTDNLLSHWAVDKKGNQISAMEVTVENQNGFVTRKRTKDENQYIVNDEELNVVKTDVPEQVENVLCLSDTNIQKQQDAPFLLSLSSGQVAQYFNKTVRLDIIDRVLTNAETQRRRINQDIKTNEELLQKVKDKREKYDWLDQVERLLNKYDSIESKCESFDQQIETIEQQIENFDQYNSAKDKYNFINKSKQIISKIEKIDIDSIDQQIDQLVEDLSVVESCNEKKVVNFDAAKKIISKIEKIDIDSIDQQIDSLSYQLQQIEIANEMINEKNQKIKDYKKQLPDVCPICGSKMKNGKCVND